MKKILTAVTAICLMLTLTGCQNKTKVLEGQGDYMAELGKMTLVTDKIIEGGADEGTAMGCSIFAKKDGEFKKVVEISGDNENYPIKYDKETGFWYVSGNYVQNLVYDDRLGVLEAVEFVEKETDDKGETTYTYYEKGEESVKCDESKYNELMEKYDSAQSIVFKKQTKTED